MIQRNVVRAIERALGIRLYFLFVLIICSFGTASVLYAQPGMLGIGVGATAGGNGYSADIGLHGQIASRYIIGFNYGNLSWLFHDPYNPGSANLSYLTDINTGVLLVAICTELLLEDSVTNDGRFLGKAFVIPFLITGALINSEHHYLAYDSGGEDRFVCSLFFKTTIDYYVQQELKWARWGPGGGIGLAKAFRFGSGRVMLAANIGLDKPFDLICGKFVSFDSRPMVSLKAYYY